jgi:hypothetical protein
MANHLLAEDFVTDSLTQNGILDALLKEMPDVYDTLSNRSSQVRLFTLLPRYGTGELLRGSLTIVDIDPAIQQYEALSYVWGGKDAFSGPHHICSKVPILINNQTLMVGTNTV